MERKLTRREFIRLSALTAAGVAVTSAYAPASEVAAPAAQTTYAEAPMLADLVKAGKLPAVKDRLPEKPCVLPVVESVGKYGGAIRRGFKGVSDRWGPTKLMDRGFVWFDKKLNLIPRIAESWEVTPDAKVWTIKLRKGSKWSDGTPMTTKDCLWWQQYEFLNKQINPATPSQYITGSPAKPMKMEAVDDYTLKLTFEHANPMFIYKTTRSMPITPAEHMKQYHIDTTADKAKLEAEVKAKGFESWDKYYANDRSWWYLNPGRPSIAPWLSQAAMGKEVFVMVRNPYFMAVDSKGNQLPYIDQINHRLFETNDVLDMWIVNGEIDFQARHVNIANFTLYKKGEEKGGFKVVLGVSANHQALQLNLTTKKKPLREFFQDRKARIALNLSVNRDKINELIFDGTLKPRQYSPLPMSPQYYEKAEKAYVKYDVKEANRLLDEAGYTKKDANGIRLYKDGSGPITFQIESTVGAGTSEEDTIQMIVKDFAAVGVKGVYKNVERALYEEHFKANDLDAAYWGGDRTVLPLVPEAPIFRGTMLDRPWADAWGLWKANNADPNGEQPAKDSFIQKIWDLWDQISFEPNEDKRNTLFKQILDIWAEEVPMVGILGEVPSPAIVKNGFKNFVAGFPNDDTTGDENVYNTETYYWDEPDKHKAA